MKLFLIILGVSLCLSLLLLFGIVDNDFFSYYYIGREVVLYGKDMFRDFAENKGIGTYLFFSVLYFFFRDNWQLALIVASTLLDAISVFLTIKLVDTVIKHETKPLSHNILLVVALTVIFKSLSIGTLLGGVYTTNIAYPFLVAALLFIKTRPVAAGFLFVASFLTRQSFIFFLPLFLIYPYATRAQYLQGILKFAGGFMIAGFCFLLYGVYNHNLPAIFENMVLFPLHYSQGTLGHRLGGIILRLTFELRLFIMLLYTFVVILLLIAKRISLTKIVWVWLLTLYTVSAFATFSAGVFYFHQFLQYFLVLAVCIGLQAKYFKKWLFIVAATLFAFAMPSFYEYVSLPRSAANSWYEKIAVKEVQEKEYLQVVSYYPRYYFDFNKSSPDRYFNAFFLLKPYNSQNQKDIARHKQIDQEKLRNTSFLFVSRNNFDLAMNQEYFKYFAEQFRLTLVKTYKQNGFTFDVYNADI